MQLLFSDLAASLSQTESTFDLPSQHLSLLPRPPQTHLVLSLLPSPDPALHLWIFHLIHRSLRLRNENLSRFAPSQDSSFCNTCSLVASLYHFTLFSISHPLLSHALPHTAPRFVLSHTVEVAFNECFMALTSSSSILWLSAAFLRRLFHIVIFPPPSYRQQYFSSIDLGV